MSYKVLYRKYRPKSFGKIIGQQNIVENLQKSIVNESFSHAYIFTGPRGTGKTSTAKVFAKSINCTNSKNGEACENCEHCLNFDTSPDIIEIDAASNNGVDEIRELRNNITLAPATSKYKIYIIDEVHMLSTGAFNALLKTLEEPPTHAIFILATTEVYKVPITILSRCQRYDFKKIDESTLINHLKNVCKEERIDYEDSSLNEIYYLSEGCARDALSILDQLSKTTTKITTEEVLKSYNVISIKTITDLLDNTLNGNIDEIVNILNSFENTGSNAQKLIKKMISYLEKIAIEIKLNKETKYDFLFISNLIKNLNKNYIDARINENIFTMIKLSFLELVNKENIQDTNTERQKKEMQKKTVNENKSTEKSDIAEHKEKTLTEIRINNCFVDVNKNSLNEIIEIWTEFGEKKISTLELTDYAPVAASENYVIFTSDEESLANLFNIKASEIEKQFKKKKKELKVVAISTESWTNAKEEYKQKLKRKEKYVYIEEPNIIDENLEMKAQLDDLFTEKIVEIS